MLLNLVIHMFDWDGTRTGHHGQNPISKWSESSRCADARCIDYTGGREAASSAVGIVNSPMPLAAVNGATNKSLGSAFTRSPEESKQSGSTPSIGEKRPIALSQVQLSER